MNDAVKLSSFVDKVAGGGTPSRNIPAYWSGQIPWASVKDLNKSSMILTDTEEHISSAGLADSAANLVPAGTPIVCTRMAVGRCVVPTVDVAINQDLKALFPNAGTDAMYLAHGLTHLQASLDAVAVGSTVKGISLGQLLSFELYKPPLPQQRRIAEILGAADEAIRSTEQLIAKLDRAKRGLLHDLLTRGVDETGSLRDPDHDPAAFARTRLGPRPASWSVLQVEDLIQGRPRNGYSPKEVDQWTGILMLGLGCLTQDGYRPLQLKNAPLGDPALRQAILNDGDLLIGRSNTRELVGLSGRFRALGVTCTYPDLMMRITPNHRVLPEYLEIVLRAPDTRRQIQAAASGTSGSMVKISSSVVCNLLVAIPDEAEQRRIIAVLDAGTSGSESEECRLAKLRCLKQGLMDDLMTGRVRVGALG